MALTRGANGSVLFEGGDIVEVDRIPTALSDSVGAGDTYVSAAGLWARSVRGSTCRMLEVDWPVDFETAYGACNDCSGVGSDSGSERPRSMGL